MPRNTITMSSLLFFVVVFICDNIVALGKIVAKNILYSSGALCASGQNILVQIFFSHFIEQFHNVECVCVCTILWHGNTFAVTTINLPETINVIFLRYKVVLRKNLFCCIPYLFDQLFLFCSQ